VYLCIHLPLPLRPKVLSSGGKPSLELGFVEAWYKQQEA